MEYVQVTNLSASPDAPGSLAWTLRNYPRNHYITFADELEGTIMFCDAPIVIDHAAKLTLVVPARVKFADFGGFHIKQAVGLNLIM